MTIQDSAADLVILNGSIHVQDSSDSVYDTLAVRDGRVVYVGNAREGTRWIGKATRVVNLTGETVLPGIIDSHMHPAEGAARTCQDLSLVAAQNAKECLQLVARFVDEHPDLPVYIGEGYRRSLFNTQGPRREDLDCICRDKPIILTSAELHSAWVNSLALELIGCNKDTPDPYCGVIKRDEHTGEPSGLLQELARWRVEELMPPYTKEEYKQSFLKLQRILNAQGITTVYDAGVDVNNRELREAYSELAAEHRLTVRVVGGFALPPGVMTPCETPKEDASLWERVSCCLEQGMQLIPRCQDPFFRIVGFKLFADMVAEEQTAFLNEPYCDRADGYRGMKVWPDAVLDKVLARVDAAGLQVHVHQIGDAAAHYVLAAFARLKERNGCLRGRHALAHVQLMADADKRLLAELGICAIVAPQWMNIEDCFWSLYVPHLGLARAQKMYPAASLLRCGVHLATHSDFPVSEPSLANMVYSAVTRCIPLDTFRQEYGSADTKFSYTLEPQSALSEHTISPLPPYDERMTLNEVVQASTYGGAYANGLENELGSLEVGKYADFVILNDDLFALPIEHLSAVAPIMTVVNGQVVYERETCY